MVLRSRVPQFDRGARAGVLISLPASSELYIRKFCDLPNRILRSGINDSDRVDGLSDGAEIFYRRLMSVVDDFGRYEADIRKLRSQCWPKKFDKIAPSCVIEWLAECSSGRKPLVIVYEVEDKQYLEIQNFDQRIKPGQKSKFPECPGFSRIFPEDPASRARSASPTTPKETPPNTPPKLPTHKQFDEWWAVWSKDRGTAYEGNCRTAFVHHVTEDKFPKLMICTRSYLAHIEPHKGFRGDNFIVEMSKDNFDGTFPPRLERGKPPAKELPPVDKRPLSEQFAK